ncbi:MAG: T9SS type A sorting domain-containing protein, partial [Bacteroidia bacterium]|nr:T9SS type A sorting domain-containing protein [Bacteroidia bacterium]
NAGGTANNDNVDNGYTELVSPVFDLSTYNDPYISYSRWFSSPPNVPAGSRDTMFISLSDGSNSSLIETVSHASAGTGTWVNNSIRVLNYMSPGSNMRLHVYISDKPTSGNLLEGGFDMFRVTEGTQGLDEIAEASSLLLFPNPGTGSFQVKTNLEWNGQQGVICIYDYTGRMISSETFVQNESGQYGSSIREAGVYLVALYKDGIRVATQKLIRTR